MRTLRAARGPFNERPYYTVDDMERMCLEALEQTGLLPKEPSPVRIDRFIEKRFNVAVEYDDLAPGILGYTRFGKSGVQAMVVARQLDEAGTKASDRRLRSTLAHEGGHGLFHAHLFTLSGQCKLFPEGSSAKPKVLCRDEGTARRRYNGDWWEFQANQAIGGLLLPRPLVRQALKDFITPQGMLGMMYLDEARRSDAERHIADVFEVNPAAAAIRIKELFPVQSSIQQTL